MGWVFCLFPCGLGVVGFGGCNGFAVFSICGWVEGVLSDCAEYLLGIVKVVFPVYFRFVRGWYNIVFVVV